MVKSLGDPHTRYSDAESYQAELAYMEGEEYEGIGAWVDLSGDYVRVTSPMRGSPAEAAGLRPRDLVIAIDGEDQTGEDLNLSLSKIKGPEGTKVVLTIKRIYQLTVLTIFIEAARQILFHMDQHAGTIACLDRKAHV